MKIRGGALLARALQEKGVSQLFTLSGGFCNPALEGFEEDVGRDERPYNRQRQPAPRAWPCPADLEKLLEWLVNARKPVLIGGHGVWWSRAEKGLEAVGKTLDIPVFNMPYHQKLLGEESEAYMGLADIHQYAPYKVALDVQSVLGEKDWLVIDGGNTHFWSEIAINIAGYKGQRLANIMHPGSIRQRQF